MTDNSTPYAALQINGGGQPTESKTYASDHPGTASTTILADGSMHIERRETVVSDSSYAGPTGPFASIESQHGMPQNVNRLTEDSIVGVPGYGKMALRTALDVGLVIRKGDGTYRLEDETSVRPPSEDSRAHRDDQAQAEASGLKTDGLDAATERTFKTIIDNTAAWSQMDAVSEFAEKGEVSERTLADIAYQMRGEPAQVVELIDSIRPAFEKQAKDAIAEFGADPEDVLQWGYENHPKKVSDAIKRQLQYRQVAGYRDLAKEYMQNLDSIDPDAILNAQFVDGTTARRDIKGRVILTDKHGREMEWKTALNAGFLTVGKRK